MIFRGINSLISPDSMLFSEWRKPFNLSIGLHIIIVGLAMLAPTLFKSKPRLPEIYTVNLYSAVEMPKPPPPTAKTKAPSPAEKPVVRKIEPEVEKPAISIQPAKQETAPLAKQEVANPVSLNPVVMKVKVGKTKEEEALDKAKLSQVVARLKTRARADQAAKDAVSKLADALKTTGPTTSITAVTETTVQTNSATKDSGISGPRGTGVEPEFYMKQYLSAVYQEIHKHWILPDLQNWDNALEAVLSIIIRRDGTVENSYFEKKSDNIYFNQFVLKAVNEASPLPPFPDQLDERTLEIGLRFTPGEIY